MPAFISLPIARTATRPVLCLLSLLMIASPLQAQLAVGRTNSGTLFISDQGLPANVRPIAPNTVFVPLAAPANVTLPAPAQEIPLPKTATLDNNSCRDLNRRTENARKNLETTKQKRANGSLLIPESGVDAMELTLKHLEQLDRLCQQ